MTRGIALAARRFYPENRERAAGFGDDAAAGYDDRRAWDDQRGYDGHDQPPTTPPAWPMTSYHNGVAHHSSNGSRLPAPVSPSPAGLPISSPAAHVTEPPVERRVASSGSSQRVDYDAVRLLRTQIGEALTRWLRTESDPHDDDIQREREQLAVEMVAR